MYEDWITYDDGSGGGRGGHRPGGGHHGRRADDRDGSAWNAARRIGGCLRDAVAGGGEQRIGAGGRSRCAQGLQGVDDAVAEAVVTAGTPAGAVGGADEPGDDLTGALRRVRGSQQCGGGGHIGSGIAGSVLGEVAAAVLRRVDVHRRGGQRDIGTRFAGGPEPAVAGGAGDGQDAGEGGRIPHRISRQAVVARRRDHDGVVAARIGDRVPDLGVGVGGHHRDVDDRGPVVGGVDDAPGKGERIRGVVGADPDREHRRPGSQSGHALAGGAGARDDPGDRGAVRVGRDVDPAVGGLAGDIGTGKDPARQVGVTGVHPGVDHRDRDAGPLAEPPDPGGVEVLGVQRPFGTERRGCGGLPGGGRGCGTQEQQQRQADVCAGAQSARRFWSHPPPQPLRCPVSAALLVNWKEWDGSWSGKPHGLAMYWSTLACDAVFGSIGPGYTAVPVRRPADRDPAVRSWMWGTAGGQRRWAAC